MLFERLRIDVIIKKVIHLYSELDLQFQSSTENRLPPKSFYYPAEDLDMSLHTPDIWEKECWISAWPEKFSHLRQHLKFLLG